MKHFIDLAEAYNGTTEELEVFKEMVKDGGKDFMENLIFGEQRSLSKSTLTDREIQICLSTINWVARNKEKFFPEKKQSRERSTPTLQNDLD